MPTQTMTIEAFRAATGQVPSGTERQLQRACERELRALQAMARIVDWYHRPEQKAAKGEQGGLPDLVIAVRPGLVLGAELKTHDGKASPRQVAWLACFGDRGGVFRSLEAFRAFLRGWGVVTALLLTLTACAGYEVRDEAAIQCPPGMVPVWVDDGGQLGLECALAVDDCACRGVDL